MNLNEQSPIGKRLNTIPMDVGAYLERLGLPKKEPTFSYLKELHDAHIHIIPFENLDVHYHRKIALDYQRIFQKVIQEKRGGFCYELNGLFFHLLDRLGFKCHCASAALPLKKGGFTPEFDHMVVIVKFNDKYVLADVGFGNSFTSPKKIRLDHVQMDYTTYWRFEQDADENYLLQRSNDASHFKTIYRFNLEEKQIIQFYAMSQYHQTSGDSWVTQQKLITIKTRNGRITLTDKKLKIEQLGETKEKEILNEDEFLAKLEQYFGISYRRLSAVR